MSFFSSTQEDDAALASLDLDRLVAQATATNQQQQAPKQAWGHSPGGPYTLPSGLPGRPTPPPAVGVRSPVLQQSAHQQQRSAPSGVVQPAAQPHASRPVGGAERANTNIWKANGQATATHQHQQQQAKENIRPTPQQQPPPQQQSPSQSAGFMSSSRPAHAPPQPSWPAQQQRSQPPPQAHPPPPLPLMARPAGSPAIPQPKTPGPAPSSAGPQPNQWQAQNRHPPTAPPATNGGTGWPPQARTAPAALAQQQQQQYLPPQQPLQHSTAAVSTPSTFATAFAAAIPRPIFQAAPAPQQQQQQAGNIWQSAPSASSVHPQHRPPTTPAAANSSHAPVGSNATPSAPAPPSSKPTVSPFAASAAASSFTAATPSASRSYGGYIPVAPSSYSTSVTLPGQGYTPVQYRPSSPARTSQQRLSSAQLQDLCQKYMRAQPRARTNPIDADAIATYLYPAHMSQRVYQRDIVWTCLRYNTLVCLPTGTGKTLIAAVAMFNFYRWYPRAKVLFVAPTKPLVNQQRRAVCELVGIPLDQSAVITSGPGQDTSARKAMWQSSVIRVLFATPQAVMADVEKALVPLNEIVFLCVDECHKAQKAYSYVDLVRKLLLSEHEFRVLGLSATPGKDMRDVKSLFDHLRLQRIELRDESDADLQPYLQTREVEKVLCAKSDSVGEITSALNECVRTIAKHLARADIGWSAIEPSAIFAFPLANLQRQFLANSAIPTMYPHLDKSERMHLSAEIKALSKLLKARECLAYGVKQARDYVKAELVGNERGWLSTKDGEKEATKAVRMLRESPPFKKAWRLLNESIDALEEGMQEDTPLVPIAVGADGSAAASSALATSTTSVEFTRKLASLLHHHPKIGRLVEIVAAHFAKHQQKFEWTREDAPDDDADAQEASDEDDEEDQPLVGRASDRALKFTGCASQSNVIVFTEFRDSAEEIVQRLNQFQSVCGIRASVFIGQSTKGKKKGMNQKDQAAVLDKFRNGTFNVLVATSVAEEGLDIGHVDLIVSFDVVGSALRIVQRFGRTGRKRRGRCVTLVEAGKDEEAYDKAWREKSALLLQLKKEGKAPNFAARMRFMPMIPDGIVPAETLVEVRPQKGPATAVHPAKPAARSHGKATSAKAAQAAALAEKVSWRVSASEAVRLQRMRADHPGVVPDSGLYPTSAGPSCLVAHSRSTLALVGVAALMADQQRQVEDGGAEESARKRQKLNAEASRQLDALMDETSAIAAEPEDSPMSNTESPPVAARPVDPSSAVCETTPAPVSIGKLAAGPPAAAPAAAPPAKRSHTVAAMFQRQADAQASARKSSARRRQPALVCQSALRSYSAEEFHPTPHNSFLSLLLPGFQQLTVKLNRAIAADRARKQRTRQTMETAPAAATSICAQSKEEPMDTSEEEKKEPAYVEAQETAVEAACRTPIKSSREASEQKAAAAVVTPLPRSTLNVFARVPPPPSPSPVKDPLHPCVQCRQLVAPSQVRRCLPCSAVLGCPKCAGSGGAMCQVCEASMAQDMAYSQGPSTTLPTHLPTPRTPVKPIVQTFARPPPATVPAPMPTFSSLPRRPQPPTPAFAAILPPPPASLLPPPVSSDKSPPFFVSLRMSQPNSSRPPVPVAPVDVAMATSSDDDDEEFNEDRKIRVADFLTQSSKRVSLEAKKATEGGNQPPTTAESRTTSGQQRQKLEEDSDVAVIEILSDSEQAPAAPAPAPPQPDALSACALPLYFGTQEEDDFLEEEDQPPAPSPPAPSPPVLRAQAEHAPLQQPHPRTSPAAARWSASPPAAAAATSHVRREFSSEFITASAYGTSATMPPPPATTAATAAAGAVSTPTPALLSRVAPTASSLAGFHRLPAPPTQSSFPMPREHLAAAALPPPPPTSTRPAPSALPLQPAETASDSEAEDLPIMAKSAAAVAADNVVDLTADDDEDEPIM